MKLGGGDGFGGRCEGLFGLVSLFGLASIGFSSFLLTSFFLAASSADSGCVESIESPPLFCPCPCFPGKLSRLLEALICLLMSSF